MRGYHLSQCGHKLRWQFNNPGIEWDFVWNADADGIAVERMHGIFERSFTVFDKCDADQQQSFPAGTIVGDDRGGSNLQQLQCSFLGGHQVDECHHYGQRKRRKHNGRDHVKSGDYRHSKQHIVWNAVSDGRSIEGLHGILKCRSNEFNDRKPGQQQRSITGSRLGDSADRRNLRQFQCNFFGREPANERDYHR